MHNSAQHTLARRDFIGSGAALVGGAAGMFGARNALGAVEDDWRPADIRYGTSAVAWWGNAEEAIKETSRLGLQGVEGTWVGPKEYWFKWVARPNEFKKLFDAAGISMISCSRGLRFFTNTQWFTLDGRGMPAPHIDRSQLPYIIDDYVAFVRDFLKPMGSKHFKFTLAGRPPGGPNDEQIKILAGALDEMGRRCIEFGIKLAPHPHIGGTLILEHEIRAIFAQTDPRHVWMVLDTAHLTLAGMDPLAMISEFYPRVAEVHYKDVAAKYRGWRGPAKMEMSENGKSLFAPMGSGGVDFPSIHKFLLGKKYKGWIVLDYGGPGLGEGTLENSLLHNRNYLVDVLHVSTLKPPVLGQSACEYTCRKAPALPGINAPGGSE